MKIKCLLVPVLAVVLTVSVAEAQDITTGLTGHWPFEEGTGTTTTDVTGNGNNGVFEGAPEWADGPEGFGGAILFNASGSSDGVYCGTACNPSEGTGVFTLAVWAYWNGTAGVGTQHFMTKSDGWSADTMMWQWEIWEGNVARPTFLDRIGISCQGVSGSIVLSTDTMPANEWVHLVVTFDGIDAALFINGIADSKGPQDFTIGTKTDAGFYIGVANNARRSFDGRLDDARVYNRVLSADDIIALAAPDPGHHSAPSVDAGDYQSLLWPQNAQLDGTVSDDGKPEDPGYVTLTWSKLSGPGNITFSPGNDIEDPTATFSEAGFYELRLRGYDGDKDACDVVNIYVRPDNNPIAHWDFEEDIGSTVNDSSANNNTGVLVGDIKPSLADGWVGNGAMEFFGAALVRSYVKITTDPMPNPNLDNLRYEISLSAWVKVGDIESTTYPAIIANGNNTWRIGVGTGIDLGKVYFSCNGLTGTSVFSNSLVNNGYWHHVAGVYDGSTAYVYIDGIPDNSAARTGLINVNDLPVTIGARYRDTAVERSWNGLIDDIRVYSYGLNAEQVTDLADMGPQIPIVDAGEDKTFLMNNVYLQLDGTVTDDGKPVPAMLEWSMVSCNDPCGTITFMPGNNIEDPCATFSEVGTYILRLTADDTMATVYDEVEIEVENLTCQDVIDDGLLIQIDISGPEGTPDCYVDMYDFMAFVDNWLRCNDPQNHECEHY